MEHGKLVKFKLFGTDEEIHAEIKQSDTLAQIYFSLVKLNKSLKSIRISYKGKFINCTEDLQEVENNSTLFVFPLNNPRQEKIFKETENFMNEAGKFLNHIFSNQNPHHPNHFEEFNHEEIVRAKLLLEQNGIDIDDETFAKYLDECDYNVELLLRQFGII